MAKVSSIENQLMAAWRNQNKHSNNGSNIAIMNENQYQHNENIIENNGVWRKRKPAISMAV